MQQNQSFMFEIKDNLQSLKWRKMKIQRKDIKGIIIYTKIRNNEKKTCEIQCSQLEAKTEKERMADDKEAIKYNKKLEDKNVEISTFKQ